MASSDAQFSPAASVIAACAGTDGPDADAWLDDVRAREEFIADTPPRDPWGISV